MRKGFAQKPVRVIIPLLVRRGGGGGKKKPAKPTLAPQTGWWLTSHGV